MSMIAGDKPMFTDLQGLERLRGMARRDDPEGLREVARHFESLFTHMMLKSMRSASFGDDLTGGYQMDFYRDMFDQQIAVEMSQGQGLGLADTIVRQLGGQVAGEQGASVNRNSLEALRQRAVPVVSAASPSTGPSGTEPAGEDFRPEGPGEFVERLLPMARRAAGRLGVAPQLVLAQAALETGWGQHMIRDEGGRNSFNLFGIKSGGDWQGPDVSVPTLEFEEGLPVRRMDRFRAYQSPAESIEDYVRFLENSPRYRQALGQGDDAVAFGRALQAGGYATDPAYAEKIQRVAESRPLQAVSGNDDADGLKDFPNRPFE